MVYPVYNSDSRKNIKVHKDTCRYPMNEKDPLLVLPRKGFWDHTCNTMNDVILKYGNSIKKCRICKP